MSVEWRFVTNPQTLILVKVSDCGKIIIAQIHFFLLNLCMPFLMVTLISKLLINSLQMNPIMHKPLKLQKNAHCILLILKTYILKLKLNSNLIVIF